MKKDDFFSVELISQIICELKVGKAAGYDKISTEHLLNCHPIIHVYITYLCNLIFAVWSCPHRVWSWCDFPQFQKAILVKKSSLWKTLGV